MPCSAGLPALPGPLNGCIAAAAAALQERPERCGLTQAGLRLESSLQDSSLSAHCCTAGEVKSLAYFTPHVWQPPYRIASLLLAKLQISMLHQLPATCCTGRCSSAWRHAGRPEQNLTTPGGPLDRYLAQPAWRVPAQYGTKCTRCNLTY
jgi:hypothetical protein